MKPSNRAPRYDQPTALPLPTDGLVRLSQIIGDPKNNILPLIPVGRTAWYEGVRSGRYPGPTKHGSASLWRAADIRALIESADPSQHGPHGSCQASLTAPETGSRFAPSNGKR